MKKRVLSILLALAMICMLVPSTVFAADDIRPEFAVILNDEGKLELNFANPANFTVRDGMLNVIYQYVYDLGMQNGGCVFPGSFNSDYSQIELVLYDVESDPNNWTEIERRSVEVVYNYDSEILEIASSIIADFPTEKECFELTDMEYINYIYYYSDYELELMENESVSDRSYPTLSEFSGELKDCLNYSNFTSYTLLGAGGGDIFYQEETGETALTYDGVVYYAIPMVTFFAKNVIYVPESTGDSLEELAAAAQKRLDDYFGANAPKVLYLTPDTQEPFETVEEIRQMELDGCDSSYAQAQEALALEESYLEEEINGQNRSEWIAIYNDNIENYRRTLEEIAAQREYIEASYEEDGNNYFLWEAAEVNNAHPTFTLHFREELVPISYVIIKDDSKVASDDPVCVTTDMTTNVKVETNDSSVPLDTKISVDKLTSGEELNKITTSLEKVEEIANVETSVTYDINLYSEALNDNITKLDNGTFKVSLPIPEELEGKDLMVYYVDDDGNVTPHDVDFDDGKKYVTFETNHFSTYTLVEVKKADSGAGSGAGEAIPQPEEKPVEDDEVIANTADATVIMPWMITMGLAGVGCAFVSSKRKEIE